MVPNKIGSPNRQTAGRQKSKNCGSGVEDKTKKRVIINIAKHPKIYEHLKKSAEINFRTIEQQALYYIWTALNIEENGKN